MAGPHRDLLSGLRDLLWPPSCAGCAALQDCRDRVLCRRCLAAVGAPLRVPAPEGLASCWAASEFREPAEAWILGFKYPRPGLLSLDPSPGLAVAALVRRAAAAAAGPAPDRVVPVPLHPLRLRRRGFNPAASLAAEVARVRGGRLEPTRLVRTRDTPSQTGLDRRARRRNVHGAFAARGSVAGRVWLVDDVVTTGATLAACGRALREAGADEVAAVCAAWSPPQRRS
ncbi:MAG: ComF family protein [Myxococcota bacterium]